VSQFPPPPPPGPPPPPPPPGTPPPSLGGPFRVGETISQGWHLYWQHVGSMVLLVVTLVGIELVLSGLGSVVGSVLPGAVVQLATAVILVLLGLGVIRAALAVAGGGTPRVGMLFVTDGWGSYLLAAILVTVGVAVGLVLFIVPGVVLGLTWEFYGFVIAEDPAVSALDALHRSAELTRGHRWQLLGLAVLLVLINVVGLLACCVGVVFTIGIAWVTTACAYRTLAAAD
jgi:hypothetical protein